MDAEMILVGQKPEPPQQISMHTHNDIGEQNNGIHILRPLLPAAEDTDQSAYPKHATFKNVHFSRTNR
jgi:hypothetical protein